MVRHRLYTELNGSLPVLLSKMRKHLVDLGNGKGTDQGVDQWGDILLLPCIELIMEIS
jgi:hypothetical protein